MPQRSSLWGIALVSVLSLGGCSSYEPDTLIPLSASSAEATTPPPPSVSVKPTPEPEAEAVPETLKISGELATLWTYDTSVSEAPEDCSGVQASYDLLLLDGADDKLALAEITKPIVKDLSVDEYGFVYLECSFTYKIETDSESEIFTLRATSHGGAQVQDEKTFGRSEVDDGEGPNFVVIFCPPCNR